MSLSSWAFESRQPNWTIRCLGDGPTCKELPGKPERCGKWPGLMQIFWKPRPFFLHDVGYTPDLVDTSFHPIDGASYLATMNAPERLVRLVAHHSYTACEAELRGLANEMTEFQDERALIRDALGTAAARRRQMATGSTRSTASRR